MSIRWNWLMLLLRSTIYLLIFYLLNLSIIERGIKVSNNNNGFVNFSLQCYQFLCPAFWHSVVRTFMYSWRMNHFIMILCPTLSLIIFLTLKSALYEINIVFFRLVLIGFIFHLFCFQSTSAFTLNCFLCSLYFLSASVF